ncbi:helix-turn-helix transcriptional regulator [Bifidobacterium samirii]|uniref:WYL domain-containing protein n=1 Tax=Bifidobacterium samirii TaxID=2306974 RepID=A0A430FFK3_9BIFI|nr:WYL domain-containing protein [Bifidobacterium samirii]RSX51675.1 WYL domain-containing protein [Bifidobacterium samirii]
MEQSTSLEDASITSASETRHYASNATLEILEILWNSTHSEHGLSTSEIHAELRKKFGDDAPSIRTVRNQLNALNGSQFLERKIHKIDSNGEETQGSAPTGKWCMSTFFAPSEVRLLSDSLMLSRISGDAMKDIVDKLNKLVGSITISNKYLTTTHEKDNFSKEFLRNIDILNDAITQRQSVIFHYGDYDRNGELRPRGTQGKPREYHVDPAQTAFKNGKYYLICTLHQDATQRRIFYIDRILNARHANEQSPIPDRPFDAIAYMKDRPYPVTDEAVEVTMSVKREAFNIVFEWFDAPKIVGPDPDGWYKVTVRSPIKAAYWWALQYVDAQVIIHSPATLRKQLIQAMNKLYNQYYLPMKAAKAKSSQ